MLSSLIFVILFLLHLNCYQSCFITNCPPGGKRSVNEERLRECLRCGPDNRGHCIGPNICCGQDFGCLMNNHYSNHCRAENFIPSPCRVPGKRCSGDGVCTASSLCCNSEGCFHDTLCEIDSTMDNPRIFSPSNRVQSEV